MTDTQITRSQLLTALANIGITDPDTIVTVTIRPWQIIVQRAKNGRLTEVTQGIDIDPEDEP